MSAIVRIRPNEVRQAQQFSTPERSLEQRLDALRIANMIRVFRADWKKQVKLGEREVLEPLRAIEEAEGGETMWDTMKVFDYLLGIPRVGETKAKNWLGQVVISPSKQLGGLSQRQHRDLETLISVWMARREQHEAEYHRELVKAITRRLAA